MTAPAEPSRKFCAQGKLEWRVVGMAVLRSRHDKVIAGVCGGLARSLGWNSTVVRILYVVVSIASVAFPGILVYIILWIVMPLEP
jgi:phage shock protein C